MDRMIRILICRWVWFSHKHRRGELCSPATKDNRQTNGRTQFAPTTRVHLTDKHQFLTLHSAFYILHSRAGAANINLQKKGTHEIRVSLAVISFFGPGAFSSFSRKSRRCRFFCPARNTRRGQRPQDARDQGAASRPYQAATRPRPPPPRRQ